MKELRNNLSHIYNSSISIHENGTEVLRFSGPKESTISQACKVLAYLFVLLISLAGNSFIVHAMRRNHRGRLRALTYLLIASIAVSDLLMAACSIPERITRIITDDRWLVPGILGSLLCKAVNFIEKVSITVSALHVLALAVHRFIIVFCMSSSYQKTRARKIGFVSIIAMWCCAALYWSPILYYGGLLETTTGTYCRVRHFYTAWKIGYLIFLIVLLTILVLVLVLYGGISMKLCICKTPSAPQQRCTYLGQGSSQPIECHAQQEDNTPGPSLDGCSHMREGHHTLSAATRRRTATMVAVMVLAFYSCFLPYWIGWILCSYQQVFCSDTYTFISIFLSYASVAVNPIICLLFSRRYRNALVQMTRDKPKHIIVQNPQGQRWAHV